jgi:hypothetical protein
LALCITINFYSFGNANISGPKLTKNKELSKSLYSTISDLVKTKNLPPITDLPKRILEENDKTNNFRYLFPTLINSSIIFHYQDKYLKKMVDLILMELFNLTSFGNSEYLCKSISDNPYHFQNQFGFSSYQIAQMVFNECVKKGATLTEFGNRIFEKEYVFVLVPDIHFPFTGWTTKTNTTYIFINPNTELGDIILAIVHELAITFDSKSFIDPITFAKSKDPSLKTSLIINQKNYEQNRTLLILASVPEFSYALAHLRANAIQQKIVNEIIGHKLVKINVENEFKNMILTIHNLFSEFPNLKLSTNAPGVKLTAPNFNWSEAEKILISDSSVLILPSNKEIKLFDYLTQPEFSFNTFNSLFSAGPGCNYCGGALIEPDRSIWNEKWLEKLRALNE